MGCPITLMFTASSFKVTQGHHLAAELCKSRFAFSWSAVPTEAGERGGYPATSDSLTGIRRCRTYGGAKQTAN
jgi:hypothetical protein